jgi:hypothetical protein
MFQDQKVTTENVRKDIFTQRKALETMSASKPWGRAPGFSSSCLWVLLITIVVSGCGSSPSDTFLNTGGLNSPTRVLNSGQNGMVYLSEPAQNVVVQVLASDSAEVFGSFTTNEAGIFLIPAGTSLPSRFRLVADTPEGVRVERFVDDDDLPYLWLNIPSHLVSLYVQRHPGISVTEAESVIRRSLSVGLDEGYNGTSDGRKSSFSHLRFRQAVQDSGLSYLAYCEQLIEGFENGEVVDFGAPEPPFTLSVSPRVAPVGVLGQVGEIVGLKTAKKLLHFVGEEVGSKLFDSSVEFGVGQITAATGWHIGTQAEFNEINEKLDVISEQIVQLTSLVNAGFLNTITVVDQAAVTVIVQNLTTAQNQLTALAQATTSNYSTDPSTFDRGPAAIPIDTSLLSAYSTVVSSNASQTFRTVLTSPSQNANLLTLSAIAASAELGVTSPNSTFINYQLRRDDITNHLIDNFELYVGYCTQLAVVLSENATAMQLPVPLNTSGLTPPAPVLNTALANINSVGDILNQGQQLVPDAVGCDQVLIDSENGLMWYLPTQLGKYDVAQNAMIGLQVNNWKLPNGVNPPSKVGTSVSKDLDGFKRPHKMAGWRVPEKSELQTLYRRVQSLGSGGETLNSLKELGFTGLTTDKDNFKKWWYNGSVAPESSGSGVIRFTYYDMSKDGSGSEEASLLHPNADPLYTCALVRIIDPDTADFGDTAEQFHGAYGLEPSKLTLARISPDNNHRYFRLLGRVGGKHGNDVSDLTSSATWTVENPSAPNVAFLSYTETDQDYTDNQGNHVPAGTNVVRLVFRDHGTATIKAARAFPVEQSAEVAQSSTSVRPVLESISISPQNVLYQNTPQSNDFQQYYCTGHLSSGETVDLTALVTWSLTPIDPNDPNPPKITNISQGDFISGDLVFGDPSALSSEMTVHAEYTKGSDHGQPWTDSGQSFSDVSNFAAE